MNTVKPILRRKLRISRPDCESMPDRLNADNAMKNTKEGTIIYAILNSNTLKLSYILFPKLKDGNIEDSFNPILTNENKYPGTIRMNRKNEINPKINTYSLSYIMPTGITETKIKRIKRIGNFLIFWKGYLNEFDMIFPKSIKAPQFKTTFPYFHYLTII